MKNFKTFLAVGAVLLLNAACGNDEDDVVMVTNVSLSSSTLVLDIGETSQLTADVQPQDAVDKTITWTTSSTAIATVSTDGLVTAVAGGAATITATASGKSATCAVTVNVPLVQVNGDKATINLASATSVEETVIAISKANEAGVKNYTIQGDFSLLGIVYDEITKSITNPFEGTNVEVIDFSNVTGWPESDGLAGLPDNAFYSPKDQCLYPALQKVVFSETVKRIPLQAFIRSSALKTVEAPGVTTVDLNAFYGCTSLVEVNMPKVTTLGQYAFYYCTSLVKVNMPQVTTFSKGTFYYCTSLQKADFPQVTTITERLFNICSSLVEVNLPKVEGKIALSAFNGCTSLISINLPNITSLDAYGLAGCTSLTEVNLPRLQTIEQRGFNACTSLTKISLPEVTEVNMYSFDKCSSLAEVDLPSVTYLDLVGTFISSPLTVLKLSATGFITLQTDRNKLGFDSTKVDLTLNTDKQGDCEGNVWVTRWGRFTWKSINFTSGN